MGFAAVYGNKWLQGRFPPSWQLFHITIKGLLPIVLAIQTWGSLLCNKRLLFLCDNMNVVTTINKQSSKDRRLMSLVRILVTYLLRFNIVIKSKHIPGKFNVLSDCLSRFQQAKARHVAPQLDQHPYTITPEWHNWCR